MSCAPTIAALLNLTDEKERFIQDRIRHMHTGRWPLWRMLAIRRVGRLLYELAEWCPNRRRQPTVRFSVLCWDLDACGLSWVDCPSLAAARTAFRKATSQA